MAGRRLIVDELADQVKQQLDERGSDAVDVVRDVLPALNRAQDMAASLLSRYYSTPLLAHIPVTINATEAEYDLPEDVLEERLERIECQVNQSGIFYPLTRIDYRDLAQFEGPGKVAAPEYYCIIGSKYRLVPAPSGAYPLRIWYVRDPEPLVLSQGRITVVNAGSNYVAVESPGTSLTSSSSNLDSYVNIVDGESGVIKATMQVQVLTDNRITFKTVPNRTSVLGKAVLGAIPTTVGPDDYVCLVHGSCIPFMKKPVSNFLVQYAVAELTRKLGGDSQLEENVLRKFEETVKNTWAAREHMLRIKRVSSKWSRQGRRIIYPTGK